MPNCFQLARKSDPNVPIAFSVIDDEICAYLGVEPDPKKFLYGWYDNIGLMLAFGRDFEYIRQQLHDLPEFVKIVNFLDENFVSSAWYEHK